MKLYAWRFTKDPVCDFSEPGSLEKEIAHYEDLLSNPRFFGSWGTMHDFYTQGRIRAMGMQYEPFDEREGVDWVRIMVHHEYDNACWYTRYVPSTDPEVIEKFVSLYEFGDGINQVNYFIRPAEDVALVKW